jgi:phenolic acid decarboxylase
MITEEERNSIINEAVEKALLMLPEIIGNLMTNQVNLMKMNREFYSNYPELSKHKQLVASVVERIEGENPGMKYEDILKKAVPVIKDQMKTVNSLDFNSVDKPSRDMSLLSDHKKVDHGAL